MHGARIQLEALNVFATMDIQEMVWIVLVIFLILFPLCKINNHNILYTKKIDIDECLTDNGGCNSNAICTNTPGSFNCTCKKGFSGDGFNCEGIFSSYFSYFSYFFLLFLTFSSKKKKMNE